jgi:hypothetical protein
MEKLAVDILSIGTDNQHPILKSEEGKEYDRSCVQPFPVLKLVP